MGFFGSAPKNQYAPPSLGTQPQLTDPESALQHGMAPAGALEVASYPAAYNSSDPLSMLPTQPPPAPTSQYSGGAQPQSYKQSAAAQINSLTPAQQRTLARLQSLAQVMDSAFTVPVVGFKIGLDGIIGLIPYVGDLAGATVGGYLISMALRFKMPKRLVLRMLVNQAVDSCIGIIPFVGDIFDIGFKANTRNIRLLQEHLQNPKPATWADTCFLYYMFFLLVVLPIMLFAIFIAAIVVGILAGVGVIH